MRQVPQYLLIGNGRVSKHFQHYLTLLKLSYQVWQRTDGIEALQKQAQQATHILLLVKDNAIEELANQLTSSTAVKIHFSGSLITDKAYGMHPLMTFSHDLYDLAQYQHLPFVVDEDAPDFAELLPGLSNPHWRLAKDKKAKYHALCVLSGNFSCLLWNKLFDDFATEFNFPATIAYPYLQQQMQNLIHHPKQALTGPLVRNDQHTINKNIAALSGDAYQEIYRSFVDCYHQTQKN